MLVPADYEHCEKCKYSSLFYGCDEKNRRLLSCDYMLINSNHNKVESRIFKNGEKIHDPSLCDKYEEGNKPRTQTWDDTNTMIFKNKVVI